MKTSFWVSHIALLGVGVWFYTAIVKCEDACIRGVGYCYQLFVWTKVI